MTTGRTMAWITSRLLPFAVVALVACSSCGDCSGPDTLETGGQLDTDITYGLNWTPVSGVYFTGDGNSYAGISLSVGDLDGDGIDELIVGQKNNGLELDVDEGPSYVLLKAPFDGGPLDEAAVARFIELYEAQNNENRALFREDAFVGDLSGDGVNDLVLPGNLDDGEGSSVWHLFPGPFSGSYPSASAAARVELGAARVSPCDLDEDGQPDLCTGGGGYAGPLAGDATVEDADWVWDQEDEGLGLAYLEGTGWWGDSHRGLVAYQSWFDSERRQIAVLGSDLSNGIYWSTAWEIEGFRTWDLLGGFDLTGDGAEDIVVTGAGESDLYPSVHTMILSAPRMGQDDIVSGTTVFEAKLSPGSYTMAAAGDFDGDGQADLALSNVRGWVTVFLGPLPAGEFSEEDADIILCSPEGPTCSDETTCSDPDHFGAQIAAGDLDGDGRDDLVINAPYYDDDGTAQNGRIHIVPNAGL